MNRLKNIVLIVILCLPVSIIAQTIEINNPDPRYIANGYELPSEHYADQPYVVVCDDGSWLCTMTTSSGVESAYSNHIVSTKSYDQGKTWTKLTDVEPAGVPQSSWAVPLIVPGGRVYVFYNYNRFEHSGLAGVMSGPFAFRYSDDHGKTWSAERYEVPIRNTQIDYDNFSNGKYQFFWSVAKPVVTDKAAYITYSKLLVDNPEARGFHKRSEGFILRSSNILTEKDPAKIQWGLLPEGEVGINHPAFGDVQEEHNMVVMDDGSLYVVYRTVEGIMAYAISRDDGRTFSTPQTLSYATGGAMGNPRACPKIYRTKDGKYLLWYHNNFRSKTYQGRNPAWLSGGIEKDGEIIWSQPEIVLYDMDPEAFGMSYPDFVEQDGKLWIIETQKNYARAHEISYDLLNGMWNQLLHKSGSVENSGLILDLDEQILQSGVTAFPSLPNLMNGGGFSIELWLKTADLVESQTIFSTMGGKHKGMEIALAPKGAIQIKIHDGEMRDADGPYLGGQIFVSDEGVLSADGLHHVVFTIDGASGIATTIVDGVLSDGSLNTRTYGWGRVYRFMGDLNDTYKGILSEKFNGKVRHLRLYNRYLSTAESVANFKAGL